MLFYFGIYNTATYVFNLYQGVGFEMHQGRIPHKEVDSSPNFAE